ncbi:MAG: hypothetical protein AMJ90_00895 [candidate division Zixibacteria bacterium SM23_73_2]|nr:MAG: hypothetical protein AMJ90_00895 [candidate division Zixibacteria bacterium SM23_73_2]
MRKKTNPNDITTANLHPKKRVSATGIKRLAQKIMEGEKRQEKLNIVFVDDKKMRELNRKFKRKNSSTDVLSFDMRKGGNMGVEPDVFGEVYVNLDRAEEYAKEYRKSFQEEVNLLVAHGILHLLGYHHQNKKKSLLMKNKEDRYLNLKKGNRWA